jgi:YidC/Oxa1 family membrane protein insertase
VSGSGSDVSNTTSEGLKFYTENTDNSEVMKLLIEQKGELAAYGIGQGNWPSEYIERFLEDIHIYTGLPWWATIVCATFAARLILLPMTLGTLRNAQRLRNLAPEMKMLSTQMKEYGAAKNVEAQKKTQIDMFNMMQQHNVKFMSLRTMIPPGIVLMSFFFGLREMAEKGLPSLKTGGTLWFTDLTVPDPYYALPAIGGALLGATLWIAYRDSKKNPNLTADQLRMQQAMMIPLGGIMLYISIKFPAIVFLNFLPSNLCTLVINLLVKVPAVSRLWNIPPARKGNILPWNFTPQDNGVTKIVTPVPKIKKEDIVEAQIVNESIRKDTK